MMIEEYKKTVVSELKAAADCIEVEQIISRSVERFPEEDIYRYLVIIYLHILQRGLEELTEQNSDAKERMNIRHALNYLKQMNENREKIKQ